MIVFPPSLPRVEVSRRQRNHKQGFEEKTPHLLSLSISRPLPTLLFVN